MKQHIHLLLLIILYYFFTSCNGQSKESVKTISQSPQVGGAFENRDFTYYGMPEEISTIDTSAGWNQQGQKILLTGSVYSLDGKTPAPNVLLYYYHTNTEGKYIHKPEEEKSMPPNELGQTHGYIRGWIKTDDQGRYFIYSVKPGVYPTHDEPAHIHMTVKEPNEIDEYYIDDIVFDNDVFLTTAKKEKMNNRGGSGVIKMDQKDSLMVGKRNIILGLNIPNYPNED